SDLSFSPDGKRIAYTYYPPNGERSLIMVGNVDGSDLHAWLPSTEDVRDFSPVFSPDNKTMIFAQSRFYGKYSPIAQPHYHAWDFYAPDVDGSTIRQLTNERFYNASRFSVPPDGKSMVVAATRLQSLKWHSTVQLIFLELLWSRVCTRHLLQQWGCCLWQVQL